MCMSHSYSPDFSHFLCQSHAAFPFFPPPLYYLLTLNMTSESLHMTNISSPFLPHSVPDEKFGRQYFE